VGGGNVGTRKATTLTHAGAVVTVVSPEVTTELAKQIEAGRVRWVRDTFQKEHAAAAFLVVAATDDEALNTTVVEAAAEAGALACDASSAERSQLIFGALLDGDDVTIAVFTDGWDPGRARRTRDQIADLMGRKGD
jgi:siroheme synthase-like protein